MALILDTGPIFALLDRDELDHARCRALVEEAEEPLVIPGPVLPEVDYLVLRDLGVGPMLSLLRDIQQGAFRVADLEHSDYARVEELMDRYADMDLGFVDAAVLAIVERLGEPKLVTLDRRHFSAVRPRHVDALELLPA